MSFGFIAERHDMIVPIVEDLGGPKNWGAAGAEWVTR
jgi:hypothetical protein